MSDDLEAEIARLTAERDQLRAPARAESERRYRALLDERERLRVDAQRAGFRLHELEARLASLLKRNHRLRQAMLTLE